MPAPSLPCFLIHFAALRDPRPATKVLYPLAEILLLMLCATIASADDFVEISLWGHEQQDFLRRFLPYKAGIPSRDTLCDVIAAIDPELFKTCFLSWVDGLRADLPEVIAVDGKTSRRSHNRGKGCLPLHTVSAWATGQRLVLGQEAVAEKSNEITAIPVLLRRLELTGALVTIDAMGTQKEIAQTILDGGANYILALKQNWPATYVAVTRS
jgi:DDE_Tnp_1-associated/Transposase DDE domain